MARPREKIGPEQKRTAICAPRKNKMADGNNHEAEMPTETLEAYLANSNITGAKREAVFNWIEKQRKSRPPQIGDKEAAPDLMVRLAAASESFAAIDGSHLLVLMNQVWGAAPGDADGKRQIANATLASMHQLKSADSIETLLNIQMHSVHNVAMEWLRRAVITEQPAHFVDQYLNQANKLFRTFAALAEARNRHKGGVNQKVTVEHVTVTNGSQATIVAGLNQQAEDSSLSVRPTNPSNPQTRGEG